jgi:hypothetical protein
LHNICNRGLQSATAELAMLMERAKKLIGHHESSRSIDMTALYGTQMSTPTTARNTALPDNLHPVQEHEEVCP